VQITEASETPGQIIMNLPETLLQQQLGWSLQAENGSQQTGEIVASELQMFGQHDDDGIRYQRCGFQLAPAPPPGYHTFSLHKADGGTAAMQLIITPARCYQPPLLADNRRLWGVALQLHAVRSQRNWGIGDFTDLNNAIDVFSGLGAATLGLNPLHALFPHNPGECSPYSPSSRLFLNPLYLDVEALADFTDCKAAQKTVKAAAFQTRLQALRASELIDYAGVAAAKYPLLQQLYQHFRSNHLQPGSQSRRGKAFRQFQQDYGQALRRHALFETLQDFFYALDDSVWGWPLWLPGYRQPDAHAVRTFCEKHREDVEFYEYLQWQTALQLQAVSNYAAEKLSAIGLYCDLAVGVSQGGAESWAHRGQFATGVRIGAPPDDFNPSGQDWGLPPLIPARLQEHGYQLFIDTLRANMRYAGALRIDHVMGLLRLFWVPPDTAPVNGSYVSYPLRELLGILALESQRNRCLIIGEDLGTVPDELRHALYEAGVLSYRVLYFEKNWQENIFKAPHEYPQQSLATVTTHDLPTLRGFWQAVDLQLRDANHLFPSPVIREQQFGARAHDRMQLLFALQREGLLPAGITPEHAADVTMTDTLCGAIHAYLARSPAQFMMVQMEDLLRQTQQVNLPGTVDQYPNWRQKLTLPLEDWSGNPLLQTMVVTIDKARGG
jgi:(1->4)-alpha-D-glucan 1-alpha-D-glucosylmutase